MSALWRIIGFFINPFVMLLWWAMRWIGRSVDRVLGPRLGYYFAAGMLAVSVLSFLTAAYSIAPFAARYAGLIEGPEVKTAPGVVIAATTTEEKKLTIRQEVTVAYQHEVSHTSSQSRSVSPFRASMKRVRP